MERETFEAAAREEQERKYRESQLRHLESYHHARDIRRLQEEDEAREEREQQERENAVLREVLLTRCMIV